MNSHAKHAVFWDVNCRLVWKLHTNFARRLSTNCRTKITFVCEIQCLLCKTPNTDGATSTTSWWAPRPAQRHAFTSPLGRRLSSPHLTCPAVRRAARFTRPHTHRPLYPHHRSTWPPCHWAPHGSVTPPSRVRSETCAKKKQTPPRFALPLAAPVQRSPGCHREGAELISTTRPWDPPYTTLTCGPHLRLTSPPRGSSLVGLVRLRGGAVRPCPACHGGVDTRRALIGWGGAFLGAPGASSRPPPPKNFRRQSARRRTQRYSFARDLSPPPLEF